MSRFDQSGFVLTFGILFSGLLLVGAGCGGPDSVEAKPRAGANKPVFGSTKSLATDKPSNGLDLSFVHADHFACVSINVKKVIANPDLVDVPWDTLESELAELVGPNNSNLKNIDRVWVLMDRDSLSFGEDRQPQSPFVIVLDFNSFGNEVELDEMMRKSIEQSDTTSKMQVTLIGERRVVIASSELSSKFSKSKGESNLARQMKRMKLDADVDALVDIGPIRSTLTSMFGMMGAFGGEEFEMLTRLPELLQRVEVSLSLDSNELLQAVAYIDDDDMTKELAKLAMGNDDAGTTSMMGAGLPFGLGGPQGARGESQAVMIPPTSTAVLNDVGREISEEGLFSVEGKDRKVTFRLERPAKIKELMTASLYDAKRQIELAARVEKIKQIGAAIEAYSEKHGCLPPGGVVPQSSEGLPPQFNWRVGILPFLDAQELYDQFDFSKPWDSPENQEIALHMPKVFAVANLNDEIENSRQTRWHVLGGPLGLYKDDAPPKLKDIADKKIWTAVIIEGGEKTAVNWTKPGPLALDPLDVDQFGMEYENGILLLNAAFDPRIIEKDQSQLEAIVTPDGDEKFQRRDFLPILSGG